MKKQNLTMMSVAAAMLILILDGKNALNAAAKGVELCIRTLIPSLFPFFFLSILLTGNIFGRKMAFLRPLERLCHISGGSGVLLLVGFLGGYPVGAQNIGLCHSRGQLRRSEAERMMAFCNNAGPSFIFGVIGSQFEDPKLPWLLWTVHILSALLVALTLSGSPDSGEMSFDPQQISPTKALEKAVKIMGTVCGWVVLFRILISFLEWWFLWLFPNEARILAVSVLELANGCVRLSEIGSDELRFLMASVILALGGTCVAMQTRSVTPGLSLKYYFPGKILQAAFSLLLFGLCFSNRYAIMLSVVVILIFQGFLRSKKNSSSNPAPFGV